MWTSLRNLSTSSAMALRTSSGIRAGGLSRSNSRYDMATICA
ncbi:MAG: hypothetical protein QOI13_228, partial [Paraburkholderia sp.]|nr:hypothetical protein [Paraburkholderia sp.]